MTDKKTYVLLAEQQIKTLIGQGCTAVDWNQVKVTSTFDPFRVRNTHFSGSVSIGRLDKTINLSGGFERKAGIYNATVHNCNIGDNVYINNVRSCIANYDIESDVIIDNVGCLVVDDNISFGNGTEVVVINEAGGREIPIFDKLSSQLAYIIALYRHRPKVIDRLKEMIAQYSASVTTWIGVIGSGARIVNCGSIKNVKVGKSAVIDGAKVLENGTINSCAEEPAFIGTDVIAKDFIISSGSRVSDGVILHKCFAGQAVELSKQYSAENSVFFANCSCYHGEACSVFAGPYTVAHHKNILLIAGMFSFLNAGSGFNQSNHMYKLGPVHQGIVERGSKAASDAYVCWPAKIGAFTLIKGRHYADCDTSDLPFSYLLEHEGKSYLVAGVNLQNIGTVRDGQKWPKRDGRKGQVKLDLINFDLLSPYTVAKMINGIKVLEELKAKSGDSEVYSYGGLKMKQSSVENGLNFYRLAIKQYLGDVVVGLLGGKDLSSISEVIGALSADTERVEGDWVDLAGLIAPKQVVDNLLEQIENKKLDSLDEIQERFCEVHESCQSYEKGWVAGILEQNFNKTLEQFTAADVIAIVKDWAESAEELNKMRLADAEKEFGSGFRASYGVDGDTSEKEQDFKAVRGTVSDSAVINELRQQGKEKKKTAKALIDKLQKLS